MAEEKYRAPALEKGLDIIELLARHTDGLSQSDIAKALDRSQSEIYRMLSTLVRRGYVMRSQDGDLYSMTLKVFAISQNHPPVHRLLEMATPKMRAVTRKAWQSCHMSIESNGDIVVVASVQSPGDWGLALRVGTVLGLNNTGTGRVLAAFRSDAELEELISKHRLAQGEPPLDRSKFMDRIIQIRELGYERAPSESALGVTNIAFPVFDHEGRAITAVNCPYVERIDSLEVPKIDKVHALYQSLAQELTDFYAGRSFASAEASEREAGEMPGKAE